MKRAYIVLGNGFSIDLLKRLNYLDKVDVINLFRYGANVRWPATGEPGFLSFQHCPNLWSLGARPHMDADAAMRLIEDVITCVNVFYLSRRAGRGFVESSDNIYLRAYNELALYLKYLFVYYNNKVDDTTLRSVTLPWIDHIKSIFISGEYSNITVITYNYDIFLERLFGLYDIPFYISGVENPDTRKIEIVKPHGSISFAHENSIDETAFQINYSTDYNDIATTDIKLKYEDMHKVYPITAIIPPAGESERMGQSWSRRMRERAHHISQDLVAGDELIMCGLSYWHVDRAELDEIIKGCHPLVKFRHINPNPSNTLTAVLTSVFKNYIAYTSSDILQELRQ